MRNRMKIRDIRSDVVKRWTAEEEGKLHRFEELSCGHVIDITAMNLRTGLLERNCPRCREERVARAGPPV